MIKFKHFLEGNGLWANIHKKRKEGRPMRKPGSKGAPTKKDFDSARGEGVNELSKNTMKRYLKKSKKSEKELMKKADQMHKDAGPPQGKNYGDWLSKKYAASAVRDKGLYRRGGQMMAKAKLSKKTRKEEVEVDEKKSETWEAGYKRRVVKTTSDEHKKKGYNWRIKGKERPEISIKLYKDKPSQAEFNKQMKRVAGHEFG